MKKKTLLKRAMKEMHNDLSLCMILLNDKSMDLPSGVDRAIIHTVKDRISVVLDGLKKPVDYY